ncbi:hypothetical protein ACVI1L_005101 [Bradyrhizobium sp. USDA 4516]
MVREGWTYVLHSFFDGRAPHRDRGVVAACFPCELMPVGFPKADVLSDWRPRTFSAPFERLISQPNGAVGVDDLKCAIRSTTPVRCGKIAAGRWPGGRVALDFAHEQCIRLKANSTGARSCLPETYPRLRGDRRSCWVIPAPRGQNSTSLPVMPVSLVRNGPICCADSTLPGPARQLDRIVQCLVA